MQFILIDAEIHLSPPSVDFWFHSPSDFLGFENTFDLLQSATHEALVFRHPNNFDNFSLLSFHLSMFQGIWRTFLAKSMLKQLHR